ncbi:hypothetical protein [Rhabdochlamydiaceae symbiont of Dictyostelium giganteum]|uniref:hypothetical protein n=1 Tax=Rhabdochlamydiaceae symbiont of Dictyostelium giganteum TaxID=3342349 RepID=UPI00384BE5FB
MSNDSNNEGVSMKEVEQFVKTYWIQLFFCILFLFTFLFSVAGAFRPALGLFLLAGGGISSLLLPESLGKAVYHSLNFIGKQEKAIQIIFAGVTLIITCVLPFVILMLMGIFNGLFIHQLMKEIPFKPFD